MPDGADRRWSVEPRNDGHGPQGTALIMELQRLRQAFDDDGQSDPRSGGPRRLSRDGRRPPPRRSKRKKKGTVERALDICLRPFGLRTVLPEDPGHDMMREIAAPLPHRRSPSISAADIEPPNAPRTGRAVATRNASPPTIQVNPTRSQVNPSRSQVSLPQTQVSPARPRLPVKLQAETPVGRAIITASSALNNGVAFLLNTGDAIDETPGDNLSSRTGRGYERELRTGLRILIAATVIIGGWMTLVPLAGAVVVPGNLVVQSNVKTIQHPTGGVVAEIKVDNGKRVAAGDLLLRLDPTQAQANLQTVSKQLDEARAKIARLTAERDGTEQPEFPSQLTSRLSEDNVRSVIASETSLFKARQNTRQSQKDLQQGRVQQLTEEISGLEAQSVSKTKQIELINGELTGVQDLYDKRLVPLTRLTTLQREAARIDGERGQLVSSVAETKSKIGEAQLQIVKVDQDFRSEVVKDLARPDRDARADLRGDPSAQRAYHRWRDPCRRHRDGNRPRQRRSRSGGARPAQGHRSCAQRSGSLRPLLGLQSADHAAGQRQGDLCVGRYDAGPFRRGSERSFERVFLHGQDLPVRGRTPPAGRRAAHSGHAGGSLHADRQADHDELSVQADHRSVGAGVHRGIRGSPRRYGSRGPLARARAAVRIQTAMSLSVGSCSHLLGLSMVFARKPIPPRSR
jgi:HlyD family secretion protein